jgi:hypothetical protein
MRISLLTLLIQKYGTYRIIFYNINTEYHIGTGYGLGNRSSNSGNGSNVSLYYKIRTAFSYHTAPFSLGNRGSFVEAKRLECLANYSRPASAGIENQRS